MASALWLIMMGTWIGLVVGCFLVMLGVGR